MYMSSWQKLNRNTAIIKYYKPNGPNIDNNLSQKKKWILLLHFIELFPKFSMYLAKKQVLTNIKNWNISLHPIRPAEIKAGYQQEKQWKVSKLKETKQLFAKWKMGWSRNKENFNDFLEFNEKEYTSYANF